MKQRLVVPRGKVGKKRFCALGHDARLLSCILGIQVGRHVAKELPHTLVLRTE
jgi:hypothetical protein